MQKPSLFAAAAVAALALAGAAFAADPGYKVETVAEGLEHPWSLAFLPDGRMLVTERAGRLRVIAGGKLEPEPVAGVPPVYVRNQAGLFDVLPARDFEKSRVVYLSFAHGDGRANNTRLISARLTEKGLEDVKSLFTAQPLKDSAVHYGGRMVWLPDGTLVLTLGDGFQWREKAQKLDTHFGKIVRLNADGSVPKDNPFVDQAGALPEIYSYGHRNVQGLFYDAAARALYAHEHGAKGGDELNLIERGRNYGWPAITYGVDYSGAIISPYKERKGMEQPLAYWVPSIAPAGMTQYSGKLFPQWQGSLFIATLVDRDIRRVELKDGKVAAQERLFGEIGERMRDVRSGPDGALYLLTDSPRGKVLRIVPAS